MSHTWNKSKPKTSGKDRLTARHEAAHAVVAVRLGLPLSSTDMTRRRFTNAKGQAMRSLGYTAVLEGSAQAWVEALPDPEARERLEALAVMLAAGCAADVVEGRFSLGDVSHQEDLQGMVQTAAALGVGQGTTDPAVGDWITECCKMALGLLSEVDDGAAWDRVRATLERKRVLSGDEVRALVASSDVGRGEEYWSCTTDAARGLVEELDSEEV